MLYCKHSGHNNIPVSSDHKGRKGKAINIFYDFMGSCKHWCICLASVKAWLHQRHSNISCSLFKHKSRWIIILSTGNCFYCCSFTLNLFTFIYAACIYIFYYCTIVVFVFCILLFAPVPFVHVFVFAPRPGKHNFIPLWTVLHCI